MGAQVTRVLHILDGLGGRWALRCLEGQGGVRHALGIGLALDHFKGQEAPGGWALGGGLEGQRGVGHALGTTQITQRLHILLLALDQMTSHGPGRAGRRERLGMHWAGVGCNFTRARSSWGVGAGRVRRARACIGLGAVRQALGCIGSLHHCQEG